MIFSSPSSTCRGVLPGAEAGAVGDAEDMRVDGDGWLAEGSVQHDIGGLAPDAGQRLQRLAIMRHLAAMALDQDPATGRPHSGPCR